MTNIEVPHRAPATRGRLRSSGGHMTTSGTASPPCAPPWKRPRPDDRRSVPSSTDATITRAHLPGPRTPARSSARSTARRLRPTLLQTTRGSTGRAGVRSGRGVAHHRRPGRGRAGRSPARGPVRCAQVDAMAARSVTGARIPAGQISREAWLLVRSFSSWHGCGRARLPAV